MKVSSPTPSSSGMVLDGILAAIGPGGWRTAAPYLLREAVKHAAAAGRVDELLENPEFLVHADPEPLLDHLDVVRSPLAGRAAAVYRMSIGYHRTASTGDRRAILGIDALRFGDRALALGFTPPSPGEQLGWRPRWATGSSSVFSPIGELGPQSSNATAVTGAWVKDRLVALTAGDDGTLYRWDVRTGAMIGEPMTGHTGPVGTLASTVVNHRPTVVSGGDDGVLLWDLTAPEPVGVPLPGQRSGARTVVCATSGTGQPIAFVVTKEEGPDSTRTMSVWDLTSRELITESSGPHVPDMFTCTDIRGYPFVIADLGDRYGVWLCDPPTSTRIAELLPAYLGRVHAVACTEAEVDGEWPMVMVGRFHFAKGQEDIRVGVYELGTGRARSLVGHTGTVRSVACVTVDNRPIAVTYADDATIRAWDLTTGRQLGTSRMVGIGLRDCSLTALPGPHLPVVASHGLNQPVRFWELDAARADSSPGNEGAVQSVSCALVGGRPHAVTAANDRTARLWNLTTGQGTWLPAEDGVSDIRAAVCSSTAGLTVALTIGRIAGPAEVMQLWDIGAGRSMDRFGPLLHERHSAAAATVLNGRPVLVFTAKAHARPRLVVWDLLAGHRVRHIPWPQEMYPPIEPVTDQREIEALVRGALWHDRSPDGTQVLSFREREPEAGRMPVACAQLRGRSVAVAAWEKVAGIWDLDTEKRVGRPLTGHDGAIRAVACATVTGRAVAVTTGVDRSVHVWDLGTGQLLVDPMTGHDDVVHAVACTSVRDRIVAVTGGEDRTLRTWDLETGTCLDILPVPAAVTALGAAPDGTLVAGLGSDILVLGQPGVR